MIEVHDKENRTLQARIKELEAAVVEQKDLVEDLRRFATVVSDSNDAVILHDLDGKILAWNRGAKETYGYTEAEALKMNVRDIVAEPDREAALLLIQKIKHGDIVKSFELRRVAKDGRILDVWLTTTLLSDDKKKPVAIATTERDITDRNRAETALKEKLEDLRRLATVVSDSNDAVILADLEGKILAWNSGAIETYGYTEAEALKMNVRDIVAEPDREAALRLIQRIKEGEIVKSFELRRVTKDGRILDVWLTTTLLTDEKRKPVAIATTERDITERNKAETALKEKVEDLRRMATVVSDSNDAVILADLEGKILAWNSGAKETYGYTEAEALKMNVRDIVAEPDREAALRLIQRIKEGEIVKSFELRRVTKDGRILDVWLTTTLLTDEKGKPVAIATTERDITDRNKAETALKEKLEDLRRLATVVSDSNDAVIMHDLNGKILAWNSGAIETYGYTEAEALKMNVRDIVAEPDREAALQLIQRIKQGEVVKSFELRRVTKDGRILDVWLTTTLLTDEKRKPVAIATTERDITERNKAETALKEKVEDLRRMATVVSDSNDAVILADLEGKILAWNSGAKETYGYTEAEALKMNVRDIVAEPDREAALRLIQRVKQGDIVKSFELRRVTRDGRILDVWLTTTLLTDEKGKPVAIATTERDITDRNKAEAALKEKLEDLRRLATVVSDSNDAVIMHDLDGKILAWNSGAIETYGYTEAEALEKNVRDIVAEPDREAALRLIQRIKQGDIVKSFELRRITKDGRILDVWLTTTLLTDVKGKPVAIATTERDITERNKAETALKEKLEDLHRMATVVSDSNDAVIMHDLEGKILAWNRGAKETYGYTEAEALEMNVRDIVAEPDREAALRLIQRVKQGDIVKSFELRRITKDGRILDVWLTTTLLSDEKGKPVAIATTERDITERNKAETALKEKLEDLHRMATVVSDSNDAVIMHDLEGKILAWNRGAKETYGYTEAEALEMNVRDIVAEPDREAALRLIQRIKQGDIVKSFELRRITKDGRILDVWLTTTLLSDEKGKPVAIATTERDITERNKAETALKEKLEDLRRLATVVSDSNDAVIMHDLEGKILAWNRGAKETYGYTEAEALEMNVRDIVAETDREAALRLIQRIREGEIVKSFELRRVTKDGRILDVWLTTTLLTDEKGKPVAIATTERDVTDRNKAEDKLKLAKEELEIKVQERTRELTKTTEDLKRAIRVKSDFLSNMSHELRTPLNSIIGFTEVLQDEMFGVLTNKQREYLGFMEKSSRHLLSLINDILDISKIEAGKMEMEYGPVAIRGLVEGSLVMFMEKAVKHSIALTVLVSATADITIQADERKFKQMLYNLLSNAVKFTPDGGKVAVRAERWGDMVELCVEDTGIGIAADQMATLFTRFGQLEGAYDKKYEGTGLGLSLVKELAVLHGGSTRVESEPGKGSRFFVTIPVGRLSELPRNDRTA